MGITRKMTWIISNRSRWRSAWWGRWAASARDMNYLFLCKKSVRRRERATWKICFFLVPTPSWGQPFRFTHPAPPDRLSLDRKMNVVVIGTRRRSKARENMSSSHLKTFAPARELKCVIKFVRKCSVAIIIIERSFVGSKPNFSSEAKSNYDDAGLTRAHCRRSQLNFIYYSSIFISSSCRAWRLRCERQKTKANAESRSEFNMKINF